MTSRTALKEVSLSVNSLENQEEESDLSKAYKELNEKCDLVLEKIKKRKIKQSKK